MLKILCVGCPDLPLVILAQIALKITRKINETPILCSRSSKVIAFDVNRKRLYDFLLVINIVTLALSRAVFERVLGKFFYFLSFSALAGSDNFRIFRAALRILKLESSRQPTVKIWLS